MTTNEWVKKYFWPSRLDMVKRLKIHLEAIWKKHSKVAKQCFSDSLAMYETDHKKLSLLDSFTEQLAENGVEVSMFERYFLFDMVHKNQ